jgi:ferritin-like metal-binding protein YciE
MAYSDSKPQKGLSDLLQLGLRNIYYVEKKIYNSLPRMIKAADDDRVKMGLTDHREEIADQIAKLEEIFDLLGMRAKGRRCDAIEGILRKGNAIREDVGDTLVRESAILFTCQAVGDYEITRYGGMHAFAVALGMKDVADLLQKSLAKEKAAYKKLSALAIDLASIAAQPGNDGDTVYVKSTNGRGDDRTDAAATRP